MLMTLKYSLEFKRAASKCYEVMKSYRKVSNIFDVGHSTIFRWNRTKNENIQDLLQNDPKMKHEIKHTKVNTIIVTDTKTVEVTYICFLLSYLIIHIIFENFY